MYIYIPHRQSSVRLWHKICIKFLKDKYCQKELEYQNVRAQVNSEREIRDKVLTDYYDDLTQKRNEEEMEAFMAEVYEQ